MNTNKNTTTKPSYRITNWRDYNRALTKRGSLTVWIDEAALTAWRRTPASGLPGHPIQYADELVVLLGTLKELYRLPLRQTTGLARSIFILANIPDTPVPDYSTLQRRLRKVRVPLVTRHLYARPIVLLVDSTGVKVSGEGEWKVRMHGHAKRRKWRKLHLAQDYTTWQITGLGTSDSDVNDERSIPTLLAQTRAAGRRVGTLIADGAYDKRLVYKTVQAQGGLVLTPPNKAAIPHPRDPVLARRNQHIAQIHVTDLKRWKQATGYHRRSRIETTMFRLKRAFGDESLAKTDASQHTQLAIRARLLNYFTALGLPAYGP